MNLEEKTENKIIIPYTFPLHLHFKFCMWIYQKDTSTIKWKGAKIY